MVRMGPTMGPRMGPVMGPNPVIGGDPLVGFAETFDAANFEDSLDFPVDLDAVPVVTGDGPFWASSDGVLPLGYEVETNYWFIRLSSSTGWLAASEADALALIAIPLTDAGTGTHTLTYVG